MLEPRHAAQRRRIVSPGRLGVSSSELDACLGRQQPPQPARGVEGDDLAVVDDRDAVAQTVGLGHVVRGQHQRRAALAQVDHRVPQEQARLRVQARWWARRGTSSRGWCISARAIISRCAMPPE